MCLAQYVKFLTTGDFSLVLTASGELEALYAIFFFFLLYFETMRVTHADTAGVSKN